MLRFAAATPPGSDGGCGRGPVVSLAKLAQPPANGWQASGLVTPPIVNATWHKRPPHAREYVLGGILALSLIPRISLPFRSVAPTLAQIPARIYHEPVLFRDFCRL